MVREACFRVGRLGTELLRTLSLVYSQVLSHFLHNWRVICDFSKVLSHTTSFRYGASLSSVCISRTLCFFFGPLPGELTNYCPSVL